MKMMQQCSNSCFESLFFKKLRSEPGKRPLHLGVGKHGASDIGCYVFEVLGSRYSRAELPNEYFLNNQHAQRWLVGSIPYRFTDAHAQVGAQVAAGVHGMR